MRAAAIFGLGSSTRDLKPFQLDPQVEWVIGLPAAREGLDAILVFGGDGTVHRHLGALVKLGLPVLVVPAGSGNDFARALGISGVHDSIAAWRKFVGGTGNVRVVDLGVITPIAGAGSCQGTPSGVPQQSPQASRLQPLSPESSTFISRYPIRHPGPSSLAARLSKLVAAQILKLHFHDCICAAAGIFDPAARGRQRVLCRR